MSTLTTLQLSKKILASGILLASLGLSVSTVAGTSSSQDTNAETVKTLDVKRSMGKHHGSAKHKGLHGIELSEEQRAALKDYRVANSAQVKEERNATRKARNALNEAINVGAAESQLASLAQEIASAEAGLILSRAKEKAYFLSILTEEQKLSLQELREKAKSRHDSRRFRGDRDYKHQGQGRHH